jgi:hypothetical protein
LLWKAARSARVIQAADAAEIGLDRAGDLAFVKGVAAALRDHAIGAGEGGVAEDLAGAGALARGVGGLRVGGLLDAHIGPGEVRHRAVHVISDDRREGHAAFGISDGGLEQLAPFEAAVALVKPPPGVDGARHGDRDRAVGRQHAVAGAGADRVEGEGARGGAGAGDADHL